MSTTTEFATMTSEEKKALFLAMVASGEIATGDVQAAIVGKVGVDCREHTTKGGYTDMKCVLTGGDYRTAMLGKGQIEAVFAEEKKIRTYFSL